MGRNEQGESGGLCGYAKTKYEERVEERRRKRSYSADKDDMVTPVSRKLHKAPQIHAIHERPQRNRLRKQSSPIIVPHDPDPKLFVLEFDPYPYDTQARQYLGTYSTFDKVTSGAFKHGAYTFSKEGLLDGSEYLSPTGRIKILSLPVIRTGSRVDIPEKSKKPNGEIMRLDIPHPGSQSQVTDVNDSTDTQNPTEDSEKTETFLAIRQGGDIASCIGVYSEKSLAWAACLKDKAMCAQTYTLSDETRAIGGKNMPSVTAMLLGSGRYTWLVEGHTVDG